MKKKALPMLKCDSCRLEKPVYFFTGVSSDNGEPSRDLCGVCYNREYLTARGIPELEQAEFPPQSFYDSFGKEHLLHFAVHLSTGLGIRAFEWLEDRPSGYQFAVMGHPESSVHELFAELLDKIRAGIGVHYFEATVFSSRHSQLHATGNAVNGRIEEGDDSEPRVVVDGTEYSWEELGKALSANVGFNFRLEVFDPYDSMEVTPHPERPDILWWLADEHKELPPAPDDKGRSYN